MKISKIGKPAPDDVDTPKEHKKKFSQIMTDQIQGDLCKMRASMQEMVPVGKTNNEVLFSIKDQMEAARTEAKENTDRVIAAVQELISALKQNPK